MKKVVLFMLFCAMFVACDKQEEQSLYRAEDYSTVSFEAFFRPISRATETTFENGDAISVFAVSPTSSEITLAPSGNYADNLIYIYNGLTFDGGTKSIAISESDSTKLAYFAIYPFQSGASNKFLFSVKNDQTNYADYTASDLCTAYNEPTREDSVLLEFNHRMSCVAIKLSGDNIATRSISVKLNNLYTACNVDINADTYTATGTRSDIIPGEHSNDTYQAIIVPQTVSAEDAFITLTLDGKEIPLKLATIVDFKPGKKTTIELKIEGDKVLSLDGYINSGNISGGKDCEVVPTNLLILTDGVAFDYTFGDDVEYYYYGYVDKDFLKDFTDDEIAMIAQESFPKYLPEDGDVGYISGLEPNTEYYIISFGCDSDGNRGEISKYPVKTMPMVTNRPRVDISNVTYSSTEWKWETTISPYTSKYYMIVLSGGYASEFGEVPNALLAWWMKEEIDCGELSPYKENDSWLLSRESTDNDIFICTWAVGFDEKFAGELDVFYGSISESVVLLSSVAKKKPEAKVVSKKTIREYMSNFVNIIK